MIDLTDWQCFDTPHEWYLKIIDGVLLQVHAKEVDRWHIWIYAGVNGITDYDCRGTLEYAMDEGLKYAKRLKR